MSNQEENNMAQVIINGEEKSFQPPLKLYHCLAQEGEFLLKTATVSKSYPQCRAVKP